MPSRPVLDDAWARASLRRLFVVLVALQVLLAVANLGLIGRDERDNESWRTASVEGSSAAPGTALPTAPGARVAPGTATPSAGHLRPGREILRFVMHQVDLDAEANLATWVSTFQLGMIAMAALMLAALTRRRSWLLIAAAFAYMSCDELAQIHEWVGWFASGTGLHIGPLPPPYPWVLIFGPPFAIFGVWMLRFMARSIAGQPTVQRQALGGLLCLGAALPLEVLGGVLQRFAPHPPRIEVILEETSETMGETLILMVLLALVAQALVRAARERDAHTP